jgi:hypothetical protein|tara:strand:+ start:347 stop:1303 length:957 start_codon:yes stop_codon:yes gene_type:complete
MKNMVVFLPAKLTLFLKNFIKYLYKFLKWVAYPVVWTLNRKWEYIEFGLGKSENRTMNVEERWFVEQLPVMHVATGTVIGILVSIFTVANLYNWIKTTIEEFWQWCVDLFTDFSATMIQLWADITDWFTMNALWVYLNIEEFFAMLKENFIIAFSINPYTTLGGLLMIGIGLNVGYIIIQERLLWVFLRFIRKTVRTPDAVKLAIKNKYRSVNHKYMGFLISKERLTTRNIKYYKRTVFYTFIMSLYSLAASITIALEPGFLETLDYTFLQILYVTSIVWIGEVVSGNIFYPLVVRLLDFFGGDSYIAKDSVIYKPNE